MAFTEADTRTTLRVVRGNLLRGLDRVAAHVEAGTPHTISPGESSTPAESGWLTVVLLAQVDAELRHRETAGDATVPVRPMRSGTTVPRP